MNHDARDVVRIGQERDGFPDGELARWSALRDLQLDYLYRLDNLELWDLQTARLVAIDKHECATDRDILLIGTVDMNVTLVRPAPVGARVALRAECLRRGRSIAFLRCEAQTAEGGTGTFAVASFTKALGKSTGGGAQA